MRLLLALLFATPSLAQDTAVLGGDWTLPVGTAVHSESATSFRGEFVFQHTLETFPEILRSAHLRRVEELGEVVFLNIGGLFPVQKLSGHRTAHQENANLIRRVQGAGEMVYEVTRCQAILGISDFHNHRHANGLSQELRPDRRYHDHRTTS